ncbi:MAG TPA: chemotaxis protein CheW [Rhodocyclaceae bacterium]|nr:chemotaxis protein CheW [Rhodocyclaceae bacterium]
MGAVTTVESNRPEAPPQAAPRQYLTFTLAKEAFAVETLTVKEIIEYGQITTVPMMPGFIKGVINLRGAVVPLIDLGVRFRNEITEITRRSCFVILEVPCADQTQTLGIVVDAVNEVLEIPSADIEPAPAFGAKIRTDFISGMGKIADQFVILLNVGNVLSIEEMATLTSMSATTE